MTELRAPTEAEVDQTGIVLSPDRGRAILRFFVPGNEDVGPGDSRAGPLIERILGLDDAEVDAAMRVVDEHFSTRHPALYRSFDEHAGRIADRLDPMVVLGESRRHLLGAVFSHEYTIEGAALCNPSIVRHPEQPSDGTTAFVMSVRGIGEGHRSSIGFRTGAVSADGVIGIEPAGPLPRTSPGTPGRHHRSVFHRRLRALGDDHENAAFVLDPLPECFDDVELEVRIASLASHADTRRHADSTITNLRRLAQCSYRVDFSPETEISERVMWPWSSSERHGMEDARFVEITDGSAPRYCATYTAFDGVEISQHLLTTDDFAAFDVSPMAGAAAVGKGLALFPRQIDGQYVALSRADRESNSVAYSDDLRCWDAAEQIQTPTESWEVLQLGNCGSPVETPDGWLVLTHGVGPMRTYSIGVVLLDLDEPHRMIARSVRPILEPGPHERHGYVPNVVYSCGALAVGDRLVLPYGVGDQAISVATFSIRQLVSSMQPTGG